MTEADLTKGQFVYDSDGLCIEVEAMSIQRFTLDWLLKWTLCLWLNYGFSGRQVELSVEEETVPFQGDRLDCMLKWKLPLF